MRPSTRHLVSALGLLLVLGNVAAAQSRTERTASDKKFAARYRADAVPVRQQIKAPADSVWAALPGVFARFGYPGGKALAKDYIFLTPELTISGRLYDGEMNSAYIDCGKTSASAEASDTYQVTFVILTHVVALDDGYSEVQVVLDGSARDRGQSSNRVFCTGTGLLENRFLTLLRNTVE